jgi:hypothetical protein
MCGWKCRSVGQHGAKVLGAERDFEKEGSLMKQLFLVHQYSKRLGVGPNGRITLTAPAGYSDTTFSLGKCQASHNREEKSSWER